MLALGTFAEKFFISLSVSIFQNLGTKTIQSLIGNRTQLEKELASIIQKSVLEFQKFQPKRKSKLLQFYESESFFQELIRVRLLDKYKFQKIENFVKNQSDFEIPTREVLSEFFEIFNQKINASQSLKKLFLEAKYQERVFELVDKLDDLKREVSSIGNAVTELKNELHQIQEQNMLVSEWLKQLDEIKSNLEKFKPYTATERLENLEKRISETNGFSNPILSSKFKYLKALCLTDKNSGRIDKKEAELFISAYNLSGQNLEYAVNAGIGYIVYEEIEKASEIASKIIANKEFDQTGWTLKCRTINDDLLSFLNEKVPKIVKQKTDFKSNIATLLFESKRITYIPELEKYSIQFEFEKLTLPEKITFNNKGYWLNIANLSFSKAFSDRALHRFFVPINNPKHDTLLKFSSKLFEILSTILRGTEIENDYRYIFFQYQYTLFQLGNDRFDFSEMKAQFDSIKNKRPEFVFEMIQVINYLEGGLGYSKSLKLIEDFGQYDGGILNFPHAVLSQLTQQPEKSWVSFKTYLDSYNSVNVECLMNIVNYLDNSFANNITSLKDKQEYILNKYAFEQKKYKQIFELYYSTKLLVNTKPFDLTEVNKVCNSIIDDKFLRILGGQVYMNLGEFEQAKSYWKPFVNKNMPNTLLLYYCEAIVKSQSNFSEFLNVAKHWRTNFRPNPNLLKTELTLKLNQLNWEEVTSICELGIKHFPEMEIFTAFLFVGFSEIGYTEKIKQHLPLLKNKVFDTEVYGMNIHAALFKIGFVQEALDFIYQAAIQKENYESRRFFFALPMSYPDTFFEEFDSIQIGSFIHYLYKNKVKIRAFTNKLLTHPFFKNLLGKKVGDIFSIGESNLFDSSNQATIAKITDKYLALIAEINIELNDPIHEDTFRPMQLTGNSTKEWNRQLIKQFGIQESLHRENIQKTIADYFLSKITFTQLTVAVFNENPLKSVQFLMNGNNSIRSLPAQFSPKIKFTQTSTFILDATSLCFFYELSKENNIKFKHQFLISHYLERLLKDLILEWRFTPRSKLSLQINRDSVVPHFYSEDFYDNQLNYYEKVLEWADSNCEKFRTTKALDLMSRFQDEDSRVNSLFFKDMIEVSCKAEETQHYIITNDLSYLKFFKLTFNQIISPEYYLNYFYLEKTAELQKAMLYKNFIGISLNQSLLYDELVHYLSGQENKFIKCLQNLNYHLNPNSKHFTEVALFLRRVYMNPTMVRDRNRIAIQVFTNFLMGMPQTTIFQFKNIIQDKFRLLGNTIIEINDCFLAALKTLKN